MKKSTWLGLGAVAIAVLAGRRRGDDHDVAGDAAVVTEDVEALARVITSEADRYSEAERIAIGWAVRNRARKRGVSIARLVCWPNCGPCCKGRPFSSARPASKVNMELARRVLAAPQSADPTDGATAFFEPKVQDWLVAARREGYHYTSDKLREKWKREGQRQLSTVGAFEFWA